jgi:hypothetical protein
MEVTMQQYEEVSVKKLKKHPANARVGNVKLIKESIDGNGFVGALIVQRSTGHILAGNHRFQAAVELGMDTLPVIYIDADDEQALAIMLADNRSTDVAGYDDKALLKLLEQLPSLAGTGYDKDDFNDLLAVMQEMPTYTISTADGENETVPVTNTTKYGGPATRNDEPSYGERLESYKTKSIRSVILDYEIDVFQEVVDMAGRVREKFHVNTNADLFMALLRKEDM